MGGNNTTSNSVMNQLTSGNYNNNSTQTPLFPPELKQVEQQLAGNLSSTLNAAPLAGQYGAQMVNPEYTNWQNQYGQYGGMTGTYYVLNSDPSQIVYKLLDQSGSQEGYYVGGKGGQQVSASDVHPITIPSAPVQYVNDPNSYQQGTSFLESNPQQIAPLSELEQLAMALIPGLGAMPANEQTAMNYGNQAADVASQLFGVASQVPSNEKYYAPGAFEASPYYSTGLNAFNTGAVPTIENQMALSGLGQSSSLADALSLGWSQALPQILSQYSTQYVEPQLGREENAINREVGALGTQASLLSNLVPLFSNMGIQDTQRLLTEIQQMFAGGGLERSVTQAENDAKYADMLRRQALAEEAQYTPMGMLFPSAIGQNLVSSGTYGSNTYGTTSATQSGGGGLFK
jgi:hypothetical protein